MIVCWLYNTQIGSIMYIVNINGSLRGCSLQKHSVCQFDNICLSDVYSVVKSSFEFYKREPTLVTIGSNHAPIDFQNRLNCILGAHANSTVILGYDSAVVEEQVSGYVDRVKSVVGPMCFVYGIGDELFVPSKNFVFDYGGFVNTGPGLSLNVDGALSNLSCMATLKNKSDWVSSGLYKSELVKHETTKTFESVLITATHCDISNNGIKNSVLDRIDSLSAVTELVSVSHVSVGDLPYKKALSVFNKSKIKNDSIRKVALNFSPFENCDGGIITFSNSTSIIELNGFYHTPFKVSDRPYHVISSSVTDDRVKLVVDVDDTCKEVLLTLNRNGAVKL